MPVDYSLAEIEKQAEDEKALVDFYRRMDLHTLFKEKKFKLKEIEEDIICFPTLKKLRKKKVKKERQ